MIYSHNAGILKWLPLLLYSREKEKIVPIWNKAG